MDAKALLLDCMQYYELPVQQVQGNTIFTIRQYQVEVEANGLYKLISDGSVVAPFDDVEELCQFILNY